jgi:hypothetical protein
MHTQLGRPSALMGVIMRSRDGSQPAPDRHKEQVRSILGEAH